MLLAMWPYSSSDQAVESISYPCTWASFALDLLCPKDGMEMTACQLRVWDLKRPCILPSDLLELYRCHGNKLGLACWIRDSSSLTPFDNQPTLGM